MEPGYTGRSKPSVRLLGSLGNSSLSNQSMVDRHAQAKAFLLNLAQEFAQESKLPLENATILQARLLLHAAVVGKKPLKLCQVVGKRPWINKYMMKHGRFTSEAMDCFFSAIGQRLPPSICSQTGTHCDKIKMSSGVRRIQGQAAKIATVHDMHDMCHFTSHYIYKVYIYTSSTAQGGGGSFKNRKPIGEVGCCESGMAERSHWWTERCLRSPLFLSLFLWLSTYLPAYLLCIYLSIDLSISLSFSLSSNYLSTYLPIYLSIHLSIYLSLSFICLSV